MSHHQSVAELIRKAEQDQTLRESLLNARSPEDVAKIAARHGLAVSAADFLAFQEQLASGELSEAELEKVAGGTVTPTARVPGRASAVAPESYLGAFFDTFWH